MNIIVNNLSYVLSDGTYIFNDISFSIAPKSKCAFVGANGCGKSSLMNILSGSITPAKGEIFLSDKPYMVPQHYGQFNLMTVAEVLDIKNKLDALHSIISGNTSENNFDTLGDDWNIEDRLRNALDKWGLVHISYDSQMNNLSGGEKTKVFLAGIAMHNPHIIFMDEPTNHLDEDSRNALYEFIDTFNGTMLIASHDVTLLNRFSSIYELSEKGMRLFHMHFNEYQTAIEEENRSISNHECFLKKELRKEKAIAREVAERQQRLNSRGQRHSEKKGLARISIGNLKSQAENATAKLTGIHKKKIELLSESIYETSAMIHGINRMAIDFSSPNIHVGKKLVEAQGINFAYQGKCNLWTKDIDFVIHSGDRIRVSGKNGSGKSTLMKIIIGNIAPASGVIYHSDNLKYVYLDQEYSLIDNNITVSEQIQKFNRHSLPEHELNIRLSRFLFTKTSWEKPCSVLSGGEKMRLSLCCLMVSDNTPDIIIADEPTNNLDLCNVKVLTNMLNSYSGTLIVISHDISFVNQLSLSDNIILC
ncbi:ABC-F family ATP-binding cassette domain-containing protein [uncultured Muribaculum sp.]|uniref:ABC-F family ATP-binding cassette domain-containing protein n=3 Tax=Bacteroidales TaxID=171549 RepID=UPI002622087B|nr:ATP-binding cassette domain-containing protein [uncultured Muribaculum sp.]